MEKLGRARDLDAFQMSAPPMLQAAYPAQHWQRNGPNLPIDKSLPFRCAHLRGVVL